MSWKKVKLGDVLIRSKIPVEIEDNKLYKRVTIRTKHQGVSVRDFEIGSKIGTKKQFVLKAGQFVLSKIDAMYGAFGIAPDEVDGAIITGNFWAYDYDKKIVSIEWLNHFTNSPDFYDLCRRASTGVTHRKYLDEDFFLSYEVYLPEIEEQENIVVSIDSIRKKISSLEDKLSHQLTLVTQLEQAILQEAVQGKLVPQDPNDEPASELLKRIKEEKATIRQAQGKSKKEKPLPPIKLEDLPAGKAGIPFDIPENWVWCRLGEILIYSKGKKPENLSKNLDDKFKIPYVDIAAFERNIITQYTDGTNCLLCDEGNILLVWDGARMGLVGTNAKGAVGSTLVRITYFQVFKDYLLHFLKMNYQLFNKNPKQSGLPHLNGDLFDNLPMPLPPLSEQKRIVAEIEKQLAKTKQLKEHIIANQQATEQLLKALLHQAFLPAEAAQAGEVKEKEEVNS